MTTLPAGNYGPTARDLRRSTDASYVTLFNQARQTAIAVDGTDQDSDPRDGFVEMANKSIDGAVGKTLVQLWDNNKTAKVRFVSGSYVEEPSGENFLATQKDRYLEMTGGSKHGYVGIQDRLSQSVEEHGKHGTDTLFQETKERVLVVSAEGDRLAEGQAEAKLLFNSGWSVAEFLKRKADLGLDLDRNDSHWGNK